MIMANSSLRGVYQPSLHQGRHFVTQRQEIVPDSTILTHYLMKVAKLIQTIITVPVVGFHDADGLNGLFDRRGEAPSRSVCHTLQLDSPNTFPILLCHNDYQQLFLKLQGLVSRFFSADIHLVNLNGAGESITLWPDHDPRQFMQPCPSGFIAAQYQNRLYSSRTGAVFLVGHPPGGAKPQHKWFSRILKK